MDTSNFALGKKNLIIIGIAFTLIIVGFLLMLGPGSTQTSFNSDIFSFRRIVLAPGIAFIGFVLVIVGILKK